MDWAAKGEGILERKKERRLKKEKEKKTNQSEEEKREGRERGGGGERGRSDLSFENVLRNTHKESGTLTENIRVFLSIF